MVNGRFAQAQHRAPGFIHTAAEKKAASPAEGPSRRNKVPSPSLLIRPDLAPHGSLHALIISGTFEFDI